MCEYFQYFIGGWALYNWKEGSSHVIDNEVERSTTSLNGTLLRRTKVRFWSGNGWLVESTKYCLKNEQECISRFKNSRRNTYTTARYLNGFEFSDIAQLILALVFRSRVILVQKIERKV